MAAFSNIDGQAIESAKPLASPRANTAKLPTHEAMTNLAARTSPSTALTRGFATAALYLASMVACIELTRIGGLVSPMWLPSAIFAWALITSAPKQWPLLTALIAAAHVAGSIIVGDTIAILIVYLIANLASPLLLAALLRHWDQELDFADRTEVWRFLGAGGLLAPGVSAAIVATWQAISGAVDARTIAYWFLSDGLSFVVFLPLFKVVSSNGWRELLAPHLRARVALVFLALVTATIIATMLPAAGYRIFMILLFPYLIFVAFEIGVTGARAAIALTGMLVLGTALLAPAPPDRGLPHEEFLISMQIYVAAVVACVLPIAVALAERQRLYETASEALQEAQQAWGELLAAEAEYRLLADNTQELLLRLGADCEVLYASPATDILKQGPNGLVGAKLHELTHPDDIADVLPQLANARGNNLDMTKTWRVRLKDREDSWRLFELRAAVVSLDSGELVALLRLVRDE